MKTKMFIAAILMVTIAAGGVFASAQKDDRDEAYPPGWGGRFRNDDFEGPAFSEEKITVTGTLSFENWMHPGLESDGQEYELLVPRFRGGLDLEEGQTVTVEGYTTEGMPCCEEEEDGEIHLWVTKAIIDGKEYELEEYGFRGMGGGMMGSGMMGGRRRPRNAPDQTSGRKGGGST